MKIATRFIVLAGLILLIHRPALALECVGSWDKPFHTVIAATIAGGKGQHCINERHNGHSTHVVFAFLIENGSDNDIEYNARIYKSNGQVLQDYKLTRVPSMKLWLTVVPWSSGGSDQVAVLYLSNNTHQPAKVKAAVSETSIYDLARVAFVRTAATMILSNALEQMLEGIGVKINGPNGKATSHGRLFDAVISTVLQELDRTAGNYNLDRLVNVVFVGLEFTEKLDRTQATFMNNFIQLALYDIFRGTLFKVSRPLIGKRVDWIWEHRTGFWEGDLMEAAGEGRVVELKFLAQ